jgi:hypothetical protein
MIATGRRVSDDRGDVRRSTFKELIERGSLLAYLEELVTCMA